MCLITKFTEPFVAKKDIVCYKYLYAESNGIYETPYMHIVVELGKEIIPKNENIEGVKRYNNKCFFRGGFIHACLGYLSPWTNDEMVAVKAMIPKGTEFYICDDCKDICAKKIVLTEEIIPKVPKARMAIRELFNDYFADLFVPTQDGVGIGYYRLADGSYLNPKDLTDDLKEEVIGVVGYIHEGKIGVIGLDWEVLLCSRFYRMANFSNHKGKDYDGAANTNNVLTHSSYSPNIYPAFYWVNNYETKGTKKGDWYLGAVDEVSDLVTNNLFEVNAAISLLDKNHLLDTMEFFDFGTSSGSDECLYSVNRFTGGPELYVSDVEYKIFPFLNIKKLEDEKG